MKKKTKRIVVSLCQDSKGDILMGQRNDDKKFTTPGGHLDEGEKPSDGMKREFKEETGYTVDSVKLLRIKKVDHLIIYLYEVKYSGTQDTGNDPDKECDSWEYVDPNTVVDKLHVPMERNVALKYYIDN